MTTVQSPPLVSLQSPKDVSIDVIESELQSIWQSYDIGEDGLSATRASSFSVLIYESEPTQQLLAALGYYGGPIDGITGPRTAAAIQAAQKSYDMAVTGLADETLITRLNKEFAAAQASGKVSEAAEKAVLDATPDQSAAGMADAIAAANPCRIITLCPTVGEDEGVTAQVSAYCPLNKRSQQTLVCCEYITLRGTPAALERMGGMIVELMITELPRFIWWKAVGELDSNLFKRLSASVDSVIIDSSLFGAPELGLAKIAELLEHNKVIADLNWARISAWQELTAEAFDPPERRNAIVEVDKVTIDYEKGNVTQALMYLGWIASRLEWLPVAYEHEGGDYDIRRVKFAKVNKQEIHAELAGIPVADSGDVLGDLISLRLSSTNLDADCCTVLCSESTGCMRMEAGGGAQSCRVQQVTPLFDQKTEALLGKQLRRWGVDNLYSESMAVTRQILALADIS